MPNKPRESWYAKSYVTNIFAPAHRNTDPKTSAEADAKITSSGDRGSLMERCLWYVQDNPDQTAGEISEGLGLTSWQVSKRLSDLKNKGLISPSGIKQFEGNKQQTWKEVQYIQPSPKVIF